MRRRLLIALMITVGVAFLLGFAASRGVFGSHGWAVALIVGASICAAAGVALVPLDRRRAGTRRPPNARGPHLLRR